MTVVPSEAVRAIGELERVVRDLVPPDRQDDLSHRIEDLKIKLSGLDDEINETAKQNRRLRQSETRIRKLFDSAYDAMFLVDADQGRIVEVNSKSCEMLGYTRTELLALKINDIHPYEMPRFREFAGKVTEEGRGRTSDLACRAKWGELIAVELSATAVVLEERPYILVLAHDARLHRLAELGIEVSKLSHDLRNILTTTQLLCDRLALSADPEIQRITPNLLRSVDRAIAICTQTLARGRGAQRPPQRMTFNLYRLADDVGATVGLPADGRVAWRNQVDESFELSADPDQIFRVLLNLGRNGCQAIEREGEIRVTAERGGDAVSIDVADTGSGLRQDVRARLFQPFVGSGHAGGTGLGLAIARDLLRGHGGDIKLLRSDSSGTAFRLEIPDV